MPMPPTGIPPVICAPWCTDGDGHASGVSRSDQSCWGPEHRVDLSIEEVYASSKGTPGEPDFCWEIDTPHLTPSAHRGFNQNPVVYLHIWLPDRDIDASARMTAAEARRLAGELVAVANEIDPPAVNR